MPLPEWLKGNHRTSCVGRNLKIILFRPPPWVGTPSTKPSRSKPHLAWPGVIIMDDIIQLIAALRKGDPAGCSSDAGCAARWGAARKRCDPGHGSKVPRCPVSWGGAQRCNQVFKCSWSDTTSLLSFCWESPPSNEMTTHLVWGESLHLSHFWRIKRWCAGGCPTVSAGTFLLSSLQL